MAGVTFHRWIVYKLITHHPHWQSLCSKLAVTDPHYNGAQSLKDAVRAMILDVYVAREVLLNLDIDKSNQMWRK